jgi:hypothetical protein
MKDGEGTISSTMAGGTFKAGNLKGRIDVALPVGVQVTIDGDEGLNRYTLDTKKFIELCVEHYEKRQNEGTK